MSINRYDKYSRKNEKYYEYTLYPQVDVDEINFYKITTKDLDRFDLLAKKYFGNSKLWWIIPLVNNIPGDSLAIQPGTQLYIPKDYLNYVY